MPKTWYFLNQKRYFDYGYHYSFSITVFCVVVVFGVMVPSIMLVGSAFFALKYYFDKYNLLFVFPVEFESHGNIGQIVKRFLYFSVVFLNILLFGLYVQIEEGKAKILLGVLYLGALILLRYLYVTGNIKFDSDFEFENRIRPQLVRRDTLNSTTSGLASSKETFFDLLKEAYIHPVEKRFAESPYEIANDTYSFIKKYKHKNVEETNYKDIIVNEEVNVNDDDSLRMSLLGDL